MGEKCLGKCGRYIFGGGMCGDCLVAERDAAVGILRRAIIGKIEHGGILRQALREEMAEAGISLDEQPKPDAGGG